ncbi:MAG: hypothetical protein ACKVS9_14650 [Phycisphaerae bacterium]
MVTTAIGASGEFDRESLRLVANAVNSVNRAAKRVKDRVARNRMYEAKHLLLSCVLETDTPEVRAGWQQQPDGDSLVLVSVGDLVTMHCPFERLSAAARCMVVRKAGPGKDAPGGR